MTLTRAKKLEYLIIASILVEGILALCVFIYLLTGPSISLKQWAGSITAFWWAIVAIYAVALMLIMEVLTLPVLLFSGYFLPKSMGLSRQTIWAWAWDSLKSWLIGIVLTVAVLELLYGLIRYFPQMWWLYASIGIFALTILLTIVAPIVIIPIFFRTTPLKKRTLMIKVRALARKANIRVKGIYEFDLGRKTRAANAMLTGLGKTRRIILSDTMLKKFTEGEIRSVIAHEMGHHSAHHLWKGLTMRAALTLLILFIVDRVLSLLLPHFSFQGTADVANFPLLAIIFGAIELVLIPFINLVSRSMERNADLFSLRLIGQTKPFVSALKKLGRLNLANPDPHPLVEIFFYTHPPIRKRIAFARSSLSNLQ